MTNTSNEENELTVQTCDPENLKCATCIWAYVFKHIPTDMSCGKYQYKPKHVYFRGGDCPKYRELPNRFPE